MKMNNQSLIFLYLAGAIGLSACGGGDSSAPPLPKAAITALISADREYIVSGESTTLTWTSNADQCSISQGVLDNGAADGSISVNPTRITTYVLTCESGGASTQDQVTITADTGTDGDQYPDALELIAGTDLNDPDSDDDGLVDGMEDRNANGLMDAGETDPLNPARRNIYYCDGIRLDNENDGFDVSSTCRSPEQLSLGANHVCIYTDEEQLRCWGQNNNQQLGYISSNIGDDELPNTSNLVGTGGRIIQVSSGEFHTCALYDEGTVRCWGSGDNGKTGQLTTGNRHAGNANLVDVGGEVMQISAGPNHTCAVLTNRNVRCWGDGFLGRLGYGNEDSIGDDELPSSVST